jgi:hypothetical protein
MALAVQYWHRVRLGLRISAPFVVAAVGSVCYGLITLDSIVLRALLVVLAVLLAVWIKYSIWGHAKLHATIEGLKYPCYELYQQDAVQGSVKPSQYPLRPPVRMLLQPEQLALAEEAATRSEADRSHTVLKVRYAERLGNNVLQYAYGLLRASMLDVAFEAPPLPAPYDRMPFAVGRWSVEEWQRNGSKLGDGLATSLTAGSATTVPQRRTRSGTESTGVVSGCGEGQRLGVVLRIWQCALQRQRAAVPVTEC